MIKDKLQICIITYNRKEYMKRTLDQLLNEDSPVRDFDIAILDNASTDGTSELIEEYCEKFGNLKHIRHKINIGGNANVVKAFEYAIDSGKEYFWGLCDDDKYDFSNWHEVEKNIEDKKDIICVSNYIIQYGKNAEISLSDKLIQMTFFPAGICRTDLLESNVMVNMYYSISDCFPHLCPIIHAINNGKEITVLDKPIVFNGLHCNKSCKELSYSRGSANIEKARRLENSSWFLGYANILRLLSKKNLRQELMVNAILHDEICGNWDSFYGEMYCKYFEKWLFNYLLEIFGLLPFKHTIIFLVKSLSWKRQHRRASYKTRQDWIRFFERKNYQNKIDKLAKKYKDQKILLYGDGMISNILQEDYDLSKLNIVAVTDRKFLGCDYDPTTGKYPKISPNKLKTVDYDVVFIALKCWENVVNSYSDKGEMKTIVPLVK